MDLIYSFIASKCIIKVSWDLISEATQELRSAKYIYTEGKLLLKHVKLVICAKGLALASFLYEFLAPSIMV